MCFLPLLQYSTQYQCPDPYFPVPFARRIPSLSITNTLQLFLIVVYGSLSIQINKRGHAPLLMYRHWNNHHVFTGFLKGIYLHDSGIRTIWLTRICFCRRVYQNLSIKYGLWQPGLAKYFTRTCPCNMVYNNLSLKNFSPQTVITIWFMRTCDCRMFHHNLSIYHVWPELVPVEWFTKTCPLNMSDQNFSL